MQPTVQYFNTIAGNPHRPSGVVIGLRTDVTVLSSCVSVLLNQGVYADDSINSSEQSGKAFRIGVG